MSRKYNYVFGFMIVLVICYAIFIICRYVSSKNIIEDQIVNEIEDRCLGAINPCLIKVSEITTFDWDKLFVFESIYDKGDVEEIVNADGFQGDYWKGHMIFLKDQQIVAYTDFRINGEGVVMNDLYFKIDSGYEEYTPETAIFRAESGSRDKFYVLTKVNPVDIHDSVKP